MPLRGKTKREVVTEFRHAEILEAARRVFAQKGYSGTSVEDIARAAGLAKGTLYLYYPSKREIYWAALKSGLSELADSLRRRVADARTAQAKVRTFMETKIFYFDNNRDFFKLYYAESGNVVRHPAYPAEIFEGLYRQQLDLLSLTLREGIRDKAVRRLNPEAAALAIMNVTRGAVVQRLLGKSQASIQEEVSFLFDLIWKGLAVQ